MLDLGDDAMSARATTVLSRNRVVCERCEIADTPWRRLRGLMGRKALEPGSGMVIRPASSVHTSFMRFPIDAVFLDSELRVVRVHAGVRPWRAAAARGARAVLELPAGESARRGLAPGERIRLTVAEDRD